MSSWFSRTRGWSLRIARTRAEDGSGGGAAEELHPAVKAADFFRGLFTVNMAPDEIIANIQAAMIAVLTRRALEGAIARASRGAWRQ